MVYKLVATRNIQSAFDDAKNSIKVRFNNGNMRDCSPENLARCLVLAFDWIPGEEAKTIQQALVGNQSDEYKKDVEKRAKTLVKAINNLIKYPKAFTDIWLEKITEWVTLLDMYITHSNLIEDAKNKLNVNLQINQVNLKQALTKIKKYIKDFEQGVEGVVNVDNKISEEVCLVSNDYLVEEILDSAPENLKLEIDTGAIYDTFSELLFIKGDVVCLNLMYSQEDTDVDMLLILLKHASDTGFDTATIGIVEYSFDEEQYITNFEKVPFKSAASYVQSLLSKRSVGYIDPKNGEALINFVKC